MNHFLFCKILDLIIVNIYYCSYLLIYATITFGFNLIYVLTETITLEPEQKGLKRKFNFIDTTMICYLICFENDLFWGQMNLLLILNSLQYMIYMTMR